MKIKSLFIFQFKKKLSKQLLQLRLSTLDPRPEVRRPEDRLLEGPRGKVLLEGRHRELIEGPWHKELTEGPRRKELTGRQRQKGAEVAGEGVPED